MKTFLIHLAHAGGWVVTGSQEAIQILADSLLPVPPSPRPLPRPIQLHRPTTVEETQRFIDEDIETRGY